MPEPETIAPAAGAEAPVRAGGETPAAAPAAMVATVALALTLPAVFLALYRRHFAFDPLIVVFGEAAVLFLAALVGIAIVLGPARRRGTSTLPVAAGAGLIAALVAFALAGAAISNAVWGDTLTYEVVLAFAAHPGALFTFLPLPDGERDIVAAVILGVAALLLAGIGLATAWGVSRLARRLRDTIDRSPAAWSGIAGTLAAVAVVTGATCVAIAAFDPRALYGEPISGFFGLVPASNLLALDNARLAAAIEDRAARETYRAPAGFAPRNVVVIFSDALRADHMGVYGYGRPTTPFLSQLFAEKRLHRVDMALSSCSESFCGISTTFAARPFFQISNDSFKLHSLLHDLGYRTRFFLSGEHRAWSYLFDFYGDEVDEIYDYKTLGAPSPNDDRPVLEALERLPAADGRPDFLYFFLMATHVDGVKLPEFDRFLPSTIDRSRMLAFWNELAGAQRLPDRRIAPGRLDGADIAAFTNRYDNGVLQADASIARIFAALDAKGYLRDSIVVILGDHGDGLGEHGHVGHTRYLYQEDIHIPLLVYGNGIERLQNDAFATQIDIAPTILDLLGLPEPAGWQGVSLAEPPGERLTIHQTRRGSTPCFAVVERSDEALWKYTRCAGDPVAEALFDLRADPGERDNRIATAPADRLARYRKAIDDHFGVLVNPCTRSECVD